MNERCAEAASNRPFDSGFGLMQQERASVPFLARRATEAYPLLDLASENPGTILIGNPQRITKSLGDE